MVREELRPQRFSAEGILSFIKGCEDFSFGTWYSNTSWLISQYSDNPAVYTKISCFLPWIAKEFDMDFDQTGDVDQQCVQSVGDPQDGEDKPCRATTTSAKDIFTNLEPLCIFPFYYNGRLYKECVVITIFDWVYLPRCPIRNFTTKINGINSFTEEDAIFGVTGNAIFDIAGFRDLSYDGYCPSDLNDPNSPLDPTKACNDDEKVRPLAPCNNNCPGIRAFGVIGGGAVLAFAAGVGGLLGNLAGAGALGAAGVGGSLLLAQNMCAAPFFCNSPSGKCCIVTFSINGVGCPDTC